MDTFEVRASCREEKRLKIFGVEFVYLCLMGIIFAALGWLAENTARLATQGVLDCRYHALPFIAPYGLIPFAFHILLGDPDRIAFMGRRIFKKDGAKYKIVSNILCFFIILGVVFAGELAVGYLWESVFGARLWDYSDMPLHVTRYAGLIPALMYGGGAYLLFRFAYKPLLNALKKVRFSTAKILCITLWATILADSLAMVITTAVTGAPPVYWSVRF